MRWVAPTEKDTANETLEKRLWAAADQFRANSGLKAGQYSAPVLGLIFLRFAETRFAQRRAQLERMVRLNRTRADYLEKFQALIDEYNSGSRNIEEIFRDLVALTQALTDEQGRHVREHLREEELTIFDILTRPGPDLTNEEREEVKKVARQLLARLNTLLALDWRKRSSARAQIRIAIEDMLDEGLPSPYTKELYKSKCEVLFEHVYESYMGDGKSVYSEAA